jgi:hypothetical protein
MGNYRRWGGASLVETPLHLHGDEFGESKVACACAVTIVGREKQQLERDSDTIAAKLYPFG